jgi:transglutaminase-like putative cysteine protease
MKKRYGRCDEMGVMFGFITGLMGLKSRIVIDWYSHVWTEVMIGDEWVPVDISVFKGSWPYGKTKFNWVLAFDDDLSD